MDAALMRTIYVLMIDGWQYMYSGSIGPCQERTPVANFDMTKFSGLWYEHQVYELARLNHVCIMHDFRDGKYTVYGIDLDTRDVVYWNSTYAQHENLAQLDVTSSPGIFRAEHKYIILDTDYNNYAVIFSCESFIFGAVRRDQLFVLSRKKKLHKKFNYNINAVVESLGYKTKKLIYTDQTKCWSNKDTNGKKIKAVDRNSGGNDIE